MSVRFRPAVWLTLCLLVAAVIWQTLRMVLATAQPEAAIRIGWPPVTALEAAGVDRVSAGTADARARADAFQALRRTPLSAPALGVIAAVYLQAGDTVAADAALATGQTLGLRDEFLNLLRLQRSAENGQVREMARYADIALRSHPAARTVIWPALIAEAENPAFAAALARRLAARPSWRLRFVQALATDPAHTDAAYRVLAALRETTAPPTVEEVQDFAATGVGRVPGAELRRRWLTIDPGVDHRAVGKAVYDGGFDGLGGAAPFNWRLASDGAVVAREEGRLAIRSGTDTALVVANQLLLLQPGSHQLSVKAATLDGASQVRFAVTISCLDGTVAGHQVQTATPRAQRLSIPVEVPIGCDSQWLQFTALGTPVDAPPSFWIDDVAVR